MIFDFISKARIIRKDLEPKRPIFIAFEVFLIAMLGSAWLGWDGLAPLRARHPVVEVSLNEVALLGFIGFYGLRISMFIAMARGLRMPQQMEWIVAIVPASIALICLILSGPIERTYIASLGYHYCGSHEDNGSRSWRYTFAARSATCPAHSKS